VPFGGQVRTELAPASCSAAMHPWSVAAPARCGDGALPAGQVAVISTRSQSVGRSAAVACAVGS